MILRDIRIAFRMLRGNPTFAAAALTVIAVGSLLFQVAPNDVATLPAMAAVLGGVALVASAVPALRAVRVDPMLALRAE